MSSRLRLNDANSLRDLFEARLSLETMLMARLCGNLKPEHAQRARELALAVAQAPLEDLGRSLLAADAALHGHLYAASGNPIAAEMLQRGWAELLRLWIERRPPRAEQLDWAAAQQRRVREHQHLLDTLAAADAPGVQAATTQHIESDHLELKSLQATH